MRRRLQKIFYDMEQACALIEQFTAGKTFEQYQQDMQLRSAVERQFEIVGESLNRLDKLEQSVARQITGYRRIIEFRNILIHGYDIVDDSLVWSIVEKQLSVLHGEVVEWLRKLESESD